MRAFRGIFARRLQPRASAAALVGFAVLAAAPAAAAPIPTSSLPQARLVQAPLLQSPGPATNPLSPLLGQRPLLGGAPAVRPLVESAGGMAAGLAKPVTTTVQALPATAGGLIGGAAGPSLTSAPLVQGVTGSATAAVSGPAPQVPVAASLDGAASRLRAATAPLPAAPPVAAALDSAPGALAGLRNARISAMIRAHPDRLELDDQGRPVVRGEILALSPSAAAMAEAGRLGFTVRRTEGLEALGLGAAILTAPAGMQASDALQRLRALDPRGDYDFNHLYALSGQLGSAVKAGGPAASAEPARLRIGLIDGGVDATHPSLARAGLIQRGFSGPTQVDGHATAVASLLAGVEGVFRGGASGAPLYAADVYGGAPDGGAASAIAQALAWMVENRVAVVNISLVGPPNRVLGAAVAAAIARGAVLVAAVGNDGPAAPPLYPASYPGVVAVTGVDLKRQVLPEAGRSPNLAFAAPAADIAAAAPGGGYVSVRGTSFATPMAAARLARLLETPGSGDAVTRLAREAVDLGSPGRDPVYGYGLVAWDLRTTAPVRRAAAAAKSGAIALADGRASPPSR